MHPPTFRTTLKELCFPIHAVELLSQWKKHSHSPPRFKQQPVLVLPGYGVSDSSTYILRRFFKNQGLETYAWKLGNNHGRIRELVPPLIELLDSISKKHKQPVTLVGWSFGGIIARELARVSSHNVQGVCCFGSPLIGGPVNTIYASVFRYMGRDMDKIAENILQIESVPIPTPSHVIYSKNDGVVHWEACTDRVNAHSTHAEVNTPHFSMGTSLETYSAVLRWLDTIL